MNFFALCALVRDGLLDVDAMGGFLYALPSEVVIACYGDRAGGVCVDVRERSPADEGGLPHHEVSPGRIGGVEG